MVRWLLAMTVPVLMMAGLDDGGKSTDPPTDTQPAATQKASDPDEAGSTLRKPAQAEILRNLLQQQERRQPIRSQEPGADAESSPARAAGVDAEGHPLLLEKTFLVERPGRLVHEGKVAKFVFRVGADSEATRTMEILPNQLLETMEREAEAGFTAFIISAEVTRYRGRNYLLLRKVLRRVGSENLRP